MVIQPHSLQGKYFKRFRPNKYGSISHNLDYMSGPLATTGVVYTPLLNVYIVMQYECHECMCMCVYCVCMHKCAQVYVSKHMCTCAACPCVHASM